MKKRSTWVVAGAVTVALVAPAVPTGALERQPSGKLITQCENVYRFVSTPMSWEAARLAARGMGPGAHLATISSEAENECVLFAIYDGSFCFGSRSVGLLEKTCLPDAWVGGSDTRVEGIWRWIGTEGTGGGIFFNAFRERPRGYHDFHEGEPNDSGGSEDCLGISAGLGSEWNDASCDALVGFVVEFERRTPVRGALPA